MAALAISLYGFYVDESQAEPCTRPLDCRIAWSLEYRIHLRRLALLLMNPRADLESYPLIEINDARKLYESAGLIPEEI
jgi:hypothetical protein